MGACGQGWRLPFLGLFWVHFWELIETLHVLEVGHP